MSKPHSPLRDRLIHTVLRIGGALILADALVRTTTASATGSIAIYATLLGLAGWTTLRLWVPPRP